MTLDLIGAGGCWSNSLVGLQPPGQMETALLLSVGVAEEDAALVDRVVAVVSHPANARARVLVSDQHLPVEVLFRAVEAEWSPGEDIEVGVNVVVVASGPLPVALHVLEHGPEASRALAEVAGAAHQDLRCRVSLAAVPRHL